MLPPAPFRKALLAWYDRNRRDLPWRRTHDPWTILVSEFMLQQTRVETVIPYFDRFMRRFPTPAALAAAPEEEVLTMWAGLGYYRRARNLREAASRWDTVTRAAPAEIHDALRALKGVGDYTAAAVASIGFDLQFSVVDGNVKRVIARLTDGKGEPWQTAAALLSPKRPGDFNQALMELGAMICTPREPRCEACPVARLCEGRLQGREREWPIRVKPPQKIREAKTLLIALRGDKLLLRQRAPDCLRLAGFWELPEGDESCGKEIGRFRHTIVNHEYSITIRQGKLNRDAQGKWWRIQDLDKIPLTTTSKKAVLCLYKAGLKKHEWEASGPPD